MGEFFSFFQIFLDKSIKGTAKLSAVFIILFVVVFVDNILGFSYFYRTNQKIIQAKEIGLLLHDSTLETRNRDVLIKTRDEIINRRNIIEDVSLHLKTSRNGRKDIVWNFLSATWYWLLIVLLCPFLVFGDKKSQFSFVIKIIYSIMSISVFLLIAFLNFVLLNEIPVIMGMPIINYLINFSVQAAITLYYYHDNKKRRLTE